MSTVASLANLGPVNHDLTMHVDDSLRVGGLRLGMIQKISPKRGVQATLEPRHRLPVQVMTVAGVFLDRDQPIDLQDGVYLIEAGRPVLRLSARGLGPDYSCANVLLSNAHLPGPELVH